MPQGPRGRGCDACRAQRKKCDLAQPSCSRCRRLGVSCSGAGVQRFRFVDGTRTLVLRPSASSVQQVQHAQPQLRTYTPNNETLRLSTELSTTISYRSDLRYSISFAWGSTLEQIPRRLGINKALDAAVTTILQDYYDVCIGSNSASPHALGVKYLFRSMELLRGILDDPSQHGQPETLCAVMLISISMTKCRFEGFLTPFMSVHGKGALQLLRMRNWPNGEDEFEQQLYNTMKGTVLLHTFVDPACNLSPSDYQGLRSSFQGPAPEQELIRHCIEISELHAQARRCLSSGMPTESLAEQLHQIQPKVQAVLETLRTRLYAPQATIQDIAPTAALHAQYQRSYGRGLAIYSILLCACRTLSPSSAKIRNDIAQTCAHALQLETEARVYLPLGWRFAWIMLMPAWCATDDASTRTRITRVLAAGTYHSEQPREEALQFLDKQLDFLAARLRLQDTQIDE